MAVKVGLRKDKPGWWVFIHYKGKRTKRCFGEGKAGERKALAFADKMRAGLEWADASGEAVALKHADRKLPTVAEYLRQWLATYAKVNCKLSTCEEYQRAVEAVFRRLSSAGADETIDALDPQLFTASQQLFKDDFADEPGASGKEDSGAFLVAAHEAT